MDQKELLSLLIADINSLKTPAGYLNAGLPNYDHLFGRDACISALQLLDYDSTIAKATLITLANYQGDRERLLREEYPGKILHEHFPGGWRQMAAALVHDSDKLRKLSIFLLWRFPYYGTIDAGAWFLILLHHYYQKTQNEAFIQQQWPHVERVLSWLEHHTHQQSHLITFKRHSIFGLRNQSWKDNLDLKITPPIAMVEVQGYYYYAYRLIADLARGVMDDHQLGSVLDQRADRLQRSFLKEFWSEQGGFFALAVNGRDKPVNIVTSNPGHLLFTGILNDRQAAQVVARLFQDDLWTPYGIRTQSTQGPAFNETSYHQGSIWPFDNWVIYQGLLKTGNTKEALQIKNALLNVHTDLKKIPELYGVTAGHQLLELKSACTVQAWSSGALLNMISGDSKRI